MVGVHAPLMGLPDLESRAFAELVSRENEHRPINAQIGALEISRGLPFKLERKCIHKVGACDCISEAHANKMHVVLHREEELLHLISSEYEVRVN